MPPDPAATPPVRPLTHADLDRVMELEALLFGRGAWSATGFAEELRTAGRRYVGIDIDGTLVGYAGILLGEESHIMTVGVAPTHRRRGIASAMMADLMAAARAAGAESVLLEVRADDTATHDLYARFGFGPIGVRRDYYPHERQPERRVDAVVMRAPLAGAP